MGVPDEKVRDLSRVRDLKVRDLSRVDCNLSRRFTDMHNVAKSGDHLQSSLGTWSATQQGAQRHRISQVARVQGCSEEQCAAHRSWWC